MEDDECESDDEPVRKKRKVDTIEDGNGSRNYYLLEDDTAYLEAIKNNSKSTTSLLESLPVELLYLIISYLSTCDKISLQMVCRKLKFILDDPDHWKCVTIPTHINSRNPRYVQSVLNQTKPHVRSLSLVGYIPTNKAELSFLMSCTSVTALDLYGSHIKTTLVKELLLRLPNLARLSISAHIAQKLLPSLYSLQHLVIRIDDKKVNVFLDKWLEEVNGKPPYIAIKSFRCSWITQPRFDWSPLSLPHDAAVSIYDTCLTLDTKFVPYYNYSTDRVCGIRVPSIQGRTIQIQASSAVSSSVLSPNIVYTHAWFTSHSFDVFPECIFTSNIMSLCFSYHMFDSFDDVRLVIQHMPNLQVINVNSVRFPRRVDSVDVLFKALSLYCPKITSVFAVLYHGDCYVEDINDLWKSISSLKRLEHLSICNCFLQGSSSTQQSNVYPDLKLLSVKFQSLILHIHTKHVQMLNVDTIFAMVGHIHGLRAFHVYINTKDPVESLNLEILLECCTELEELYLMCCIQSEGGLGTNLIHSPSIGRLKSLTLINVHLTKPFFTDLVPIGLNNTNLQMLHLQAHKMHTDEMTRILEQCPSLVSFTVYFHSSFTSEAQDCKVARKTAKQLKLLNFNIENRYMLKNSIPNDFDFSMLKFM